MKKKEKDDLVKLRKELNNFKNENEYDEEIDGMNILHYLSSKEQPDFEKIKLILNSKINLNSINAKNLKTAAHYLFENKEIDEIIEPILKLKPDLNMRDKEKNDSLLVACNNPHLSYKSLKSLINSKLDVNSENSHKWTPLHYICSTNNKDSEKKIRFLLKEKAKINHQDVHLQSPFLLYLSSSLAYSPQILSTLLENKADPILCDLYNQSPLSFATKNSSFSKGHFYKIIFFFF